jgi:nucleoside-diphosphate-sugar epimerase
MRTLVTGANGFVGRVLCQRLKRDGHFVRAAVRRDSVIAGVDECLSIGELGGTTQWSDAVRSIDTVFHLAGRVHTRGDRSRRSAVEYQRIIVDGTSSLLHSAVGSGVARFMFVSSVNVNGEATHEQPFREDDEPRPADEYGRSKLRAEWMLREAASQSKIIVTIVRPPLVYGEGVRANFLTLLRAVDRKLPFPLASVRNRRSFVYVGNVADALVFLATKKCRHDLFFVSDGDPLSTPELIRAIGRALHRRPLLFPVPTTILEVAAKTPLLRSRLQRLTASLEVDGSRLLEEGWKAPFTFDCGLERTVAWYLSSRQ